MAKERILQFEKLGLGLFVHYGVYSVLERGEWARAATGETDEEYDRYLNKFVPGKKWADTIAAFAKKNGFRYIVLTTRHHDGFSLYDTKGLSEFDINHLPGGRRDLVGEFVAACRKHGCVPYFYHTLIDWREEKRRGTFAEYLCYLRESIRLLCTNYGKIGGFWFDGQWKYPNAEWELDALYKVIRTHQPEAMIINNSGLNALGEKTHPEIDAVTFERATMDRFDRSLANGEYSAEMCQTLNSHWGYARRDLSYRSVPELIGDIIACRCHGGNFLLNIGPLPDGSIRKIDRAMIDLIGDWNRDNREWLYDAEPCEDHLNEGYCIVRRGDCSYVIFPDVPMQLDPDIQRFQESSAIATIGNADKIKEAIWLDDGSPIEPEYRQGKAVIRPVPFRYGTNLCARVARLKY